MITPNVIQCNLVCSSCGPIALDNANKMAKTFSCERACRSCSVRQELPAHRSGAAPAGHSKETLTVAHTGRDSDTCQPAGQDELCLQHRPSSAGRAAPGSAYKQTTKSLSLYLEEVPFTGQVPRLSELLSFTLKSSLSSHEHSCTDTVAQRTNCTHVTLHSLALPGLHTLHSTEHRTFSMHSRTTGSYSTA